MILFALLACGSRQIYFTVDETSHLAAGYTFLAQIANRVADPAWTTSFRGHPLLVNAWEALPLYVGTPDIPISSLVGWKQDYSQYARAMAPLLTAPIERAAVAGRTPAMLLTVLLAAVIYRWGQDLWGGWGGLLALAVLIFDPTLLAHGRLATNDVGVTALGALGLYLVWRWSRRPTLGRALACGLVLGMTTVAKSSGVFWAAIGTGWAGLAWLKRRKRERRWLQALLMGLAAFTVLWAMYGFSTGPLPDWPAISVPAPQHWQGVFRHSALKDDSWMTALGKLRRTPWPWYFPLAFAIKNPLPLLITLPLAVATLWRERAARRLGILLTFAMPYITLAIVRGPNLSYRHMLPIHPLLYLLIAGGVVRGQRLWARRPALRRWAAVALGALGLWYVVGTMSLFPFELSFFNELTGGPDQGWRYLESDTDWGHGWSALRTFRDERGISFSFSGSDGYAVVTPYDLWETSLPPLRLTTNAIFQPWLFPTPGDYVISANTLNGHLLVNRDNFAWFRYRPPDAVIAHSLYYFHVDESEAPQWLAQCAKPVAPLNEEDVQEGFGDIGLRTVSFDCTQSWIYPYGGASQGVYALHGDLLHEETLRERLYLSTAQPRDPFIARRVDDLEMAFRQWENQDQPAFALFERAALAPPTIPTTTVYAAPADTVPLALTGQRPHLSPETSSTISPTAAALHLDGPLAFLGAVSVIEGDTLEIETWWRVVEGPTARAVAPSTARAFSVMAHLITDDGAVLGVADGLGVPPLVMASGDVLAQRHRFAALPTGASAWLRTGGYWLDTGDMWNIPATRAHSHAHSGDNNALFIKIDG